MFFCLIENFVPQLRAVWWPIAGCPAPISKPTIEGQSFQPGKSAKSIRYKQVYTQPLDIFSYASRYIRFHGIYT